MKKHKSKLTAKQNVGSYFIIKLNIYPFDIMVSIDEPDEAILERLIREGNTKKEFKEILNLDETVRGICIMLPSNQTVIRLKRFHKKHDMIGVIVHEAFHATTFILERIGVKLGLSVSDEAYAYLIEFITTEIYNKLEF